MRKATLLKRNYQGSFKRVSVQRSKNEVPESRLWSVVILIYSVRKLNPSWTSRLGQKVTGIQS